MIAVDTSPLAPALFAADERYLVPRSDCDAFIPAILALCAHTEASLVVPTRDEELPVFASSLTTFEAADVLVAVSSVATVETCRDKRAFVRFCLAHGHSVPRTYSPEEIPAAQLPLFIRPSAGKGGSGASFVTTRAELAVALQRTTAPVVQEVCTDAEFTVDVFCDLQHRPISVVPRERVLVIGGESYVGRTVRDGILIDAAARLAGDLGIVGHATVQCFYDGETVRFIEVNPRYGGAANLGFAAGAPTPEYLVDIALGRHIEPRLGEFQDQLVMLRHTQDMFFESDELDVPTWG